MTSTEPRSDFLAADPHEPSTDRRLLSAAREGSAGAFSVLYNRYRAHAVAVARAELPKAEGSAAEDVAELAFVRVFTALRNGKGPDDTLRYYLATAVRREAWRHQRRRRRHRELTEEYSNGEPVIYLADHDRPDASEAEPLGSHVLLSQAFEGLSDRWRHILWLTEVEGRKPAEVAPMLGLSASSAAALAYRARQGLLTSYLSVYGRSGRPAECQRLIDRLGAFMAGGRSEQGFDDVVSHLDGCASCRDITRGVDVVGVSLKGLAPFGLLTTGLWAKGLLAVGGSGVAAASAIVGGAGTGALATSGVAAGGSASGASAGVLTAAAVVAALAVGAAAVGLAGGFGSRGDTGTVATAPERRSVTEPPATSGPVVTSAAAPESIPSTTAAPRTTPSTTTPSPSTTTTPVTTTPVTTSSPVPAAATPPKASLPPRTPKAPQTTTTTTPPTTTSTSPTTSTLPEKLPGPSETRSMRGRVLIDETGAGLPNVTIWLLGIDHFAFRAVSTDAEGNWLAEDLREGSYQVIAYYGDAYRSIDAAEEPAGESLYRVVLGRLEAMTGTIDVLDLRLTPR